MCMIIKKRVTGSVPLDEAFPYNIDFDSNGNGDSDGDRLLQDLEIIRVTLSLPSPPVPKTMTIEELRQYLSIHDGESTEASRGFMEDLQQATGHIKHKHTHKKKNKKESHMIARISVLLLSILVFISIYLFFGVIIFVLMFLIVLVTITINTQKKNIYFEGEESDRIMKYIDFNKKYRRVDSIDKADIILDNQFSWGSVQSRSEVQEVLEKYRTMNIVVLIIWITDCNDSYDVPSNVIFYKTCFFKSLSDPNEEALAYMWEGMDRAPILPHTSRPTVGFCGGAWSNRKPLLEALEAHPDIDTRFIRRESFWGGQPDGEQVKKEFRENMEASHFTVCDRGRGNFTIRFYQALSAGRIPLFVDTDMKLPYEKDITWDDIIVRGRTPDQVIAKLLVFWKERDIMKVQSDAYTLYQTHFRPEIYLNNIIHETIQRVKMSSPPS